MVSSSLSVFSSIYNQGVKARFRQIFVPNTSFCRSILFLLKKEGFITSYSIASSRFICVSPNYSFSFRLFPAPTTRVKFFSHHKLKSAVNKGQLFIVLTPYGYIFSNLAVINKFGGSVIYELKKNN